MPAAATAPFGDHGGAVVRAARAEEGRAREGERAGPALELVQVLDARLHRLDARLAGQPLGDGARDRVGVELAHGRDQRPLLLVLLADHARPVRPAVEEVLGEHLEEGTLLLDDQDLLEPLRELADDARLHGEHEAHLEDAHAGAAQPGLVQAQLGQRLAHVVVGLARGQDAEPGVRGGHRDAVELVLPRVPPGQLHAREMDGPFHVEPVGRDDVEVDLVLEGLAVELHGGNDGLDALGRDLDGARLVRHVGHDLHRPPRGRRCARA